MFEVVEDVAFDVALKLEGRGEAVAAVPPHAVSNALTPVDPGRGGPNGGYLAALAIRAAERVLSPAAPIRAVSLQYLARPAFAPLELKVERTRGARATTFGRLEAIQADATMFTAQATFGAVGQSPRFRGGGPGRDTPHPEKLAPLDLSPALAPHFAGLVDYRPAGGGFPFAGGDEARIRIWMRVNDRRPLDASRLSFLLDAVFPAFYAVLTRPVPAATVDLRYDFLRPITPDLAPDGWALFEFTTRDFADGWAVEDGVAWSRSGEMLAVARQLRKVLAKGSSQA